ncbi:MAG: hypothetical protein ACHQRM_16470 [Bacteroidia bacterium]
MKTKSLKSAIPTDVDQLINDENDKALRASWKNSLAHQIQAEALPEFDEVKRELEELFSEMFGEGS